MERNDRIRSAYRLTGGNSFYDGMITCSTLLGKLVCRIVWDMNADDTANYQTQALSGIPEGFSGRLEVPVEQVYLQCLFIKQYQAPILPALTIRPI